MPFGPDHPHPVPDRQVEQQRRERAALDEPDVELVALGPGDGRRRGDRVRSLDDLLADASRRSSCTARARTASARRRSGPRSRRATRSRRRAGRGSRCRRARRARSAARVGHRVGRWARRSGRSSRATGLRRGGRRADGTARPGPRTGAGGMVRGCRSALPTPFRNPGRTGDAGTIATCSDASPAPAARVGARLRGARPDGHRPPCPAPTAAHQAAKRYIYAWGEGTAEGNGTMKDLLGGKGAGLAEMTHRRPADPARLHDHDRGLQRLLRGRQAAARGPLGRRARGDARGRAALRQGLRRRGEPAARLGPLGRQVLDARDDGHRPQPRPQRGDAEGPDRPHRATSASAGTPTAGSSRCSAGSSWT